MQLKTKGKYFSLLKVESTESLLLLLNMDTYTVLFLKICLLFMHCVCNVFGVPEANIKHSDSPF